MKIVNHHSWNGKSGTHAQLNFFFDLADSFKPSDIDSSVCAPLETSVNQWRL